MGCARPRYRAPVLVSSLPPSPSLRRRLADASTSLHVGHSHHSGNETTFSNASNMSGAAAMNRALESCLNQLRGVLS